MAVTTPYRKLLRFKHGPLLDMQFEIGEQFAGRARCGADVIGIEAEGDHRLAHRDTRFVAATEHTLDKSPGHRAAAEQRRGEAHALLVGEGGDLDGEWQTKAATVEIANAGNRRDDPERSVPAAGIAHGVVM
jgi:hypothetical protein